MKKIVYVVCIILLSGLVLLSAFWAWSEKKRAEKQKCQLDSLQNENHRLDSILYFYGSEIETIQKELQDLNKK